MLTTRDLPAVDEVPARVQGPTWHDARRRQLLKEHPEVKRLIGPNRWTAAVVLLLVVGQLAVAVLVREWPIWAVVVAAYGFGAFAAHGLGVLIHDLAHDLVFKSGTANRCLTLVANVPLVFPGAIDFRDAHLAHHAHLGEPDGADTQAPRPWEFRVARGRLGTLLWYIVAPLAANGGGPTERASKWVVLNWAVNLAVMLPFASQFGLTALVYLGASGLLAFGQHPVGIRRYGEHLVLAPGQPTASYYGPLNRVAFDVGYHVEHHDLPSVPWNRLRALRSTAPELYRDLGSIPSWAALLARLVLIRDEGPARYFRGLPR